MKDGQLNIEYTSYEGGEWNIAKCYALDFLDAMETGELKTNKLKTFARPAAMRIVGSPLIYDFVLKHRYGQLVRNWLS